jgi:hypothetical protein
VAALQVWRTWTLMPGAGDLDVATTLSFLASMVQSIAPPLLGVALFWRHPDARTTMPLLVFGLALFALGALLSAFEEPIREVLRVIAPSVEGPDFMLDSPAVFAFRVLTALLSIIAVLYTAAGLSASRVRERSVAERPVAIWMSAIAIVATVFSLAAITQADFESTPAFLIQLAIGTLLSAFVTLAWAYLVTVTVGGWMARETPHRAWGLAALAGSTLFASRVVFTLLTSLPVGESAMPVFQLVGYAALAAWLVLLAGFWLGLPKSPDSKPAEAETGPTADPREATLPGSAAG